MTSQTRSNVIALLGDAARIANTVAYSRQTHHLPLLPGGGVYIHTAHADLTLVRADIPQVIVEAALRPSFAWRVRAQSDALGVRVVALRRRMMVSGGLARLTITVPRAAPLILRLQSVRLTVTAVTGVFTIAAGDDPSFLTPAR